MIDTVKHVFTATVFDGDDGDVSRWINDQLKPYIHKFFQLSVLGCGGGGNFYISIDFSGEFIENPEQMLNDIRHSTIAITPVDWTVDWDHWTYEVEPEN